MQFRAIFYHMQLILYAAMGTITNPCLTGHNNNKPLPRGAPLTNDKFLFLGYVLTA